MEMGKHLNKLNTFLPSILLCKPTETVQYTGACACMWATQVNLPAGIITASASVSFTDLYIFVNHEYANDEYVHESCSRAPKMITPSSSARIFPSLAG